MARNTIIETDACLSEIVRAARALLATIDADASAESWTYPFTSEREVLRNALAKLDAQP